MDEGRRIKVFHAFEKDEMAVVQGDAPKGGGRGLGDAVGGMLRNEEAEEKNNIDGQGEKPQDEKRGVSKGSAGSLMRRGKTAAKAIARFSKGGSSGRESDISGTATPVSRGPSSPSSETDSVKGDQTDGQAVIFKPNKPVILPTSDVNIALERKSLAPGLSVTTAVAHTWFNVFFEGQGPEKLALKPEERPLDGGVFSVDWEEMDGIKGSRQRGAKAVERIDVVWKVAVEGNALDRDGLRGTASMTGEEIEEPREGIAVKEPGPADWRGEDRRKVDPDAGKRLGGGELEGDDEIQELNMVKSAGAKGEKL